MKPEPGDLLGFVVDGRLLLAEMPPQPVQQAMKRSLAAISKGKRPKLADMKLIRLWLAAMDERFGGYITVDT